jgi:hypothetical protein
MIKFSEEGMLKAKGSLLCTVTTAKEKLLWKIKSAIPMNCE